MAECVSSHQAESESQCSDLISSSNTLKRHWSDHVSWPQPKHQRIQLSIKASPIVTLQDGQRGSPSTISFKHSFLELPAEVRIMIYRLLLVSPSEKRLVTATHRLSRISESRRQDGEVDVDTRHHQQPPVLVPERPTPILPNRIQRIKESNPETNNNVRTSDIDVAILRVRRSIYNEARQVLYAENSFYVCCIPTMPTLAALQQRTRAHIKILRVQMDHTAIRTMPALMRFGLRHCWQLKKLTLSQASNMQQIYDSSDPRACCNSLQYLPAACEIVLDGNPESWPLELRRAVETRSRT